MNPRSMWAWVGSWAQKLACLAFGVITLIIPEQSSITSPSSSRSTSHLSWDPLFFNHQPVQRVPGAVLTNYVGAAMRNRRNAQGWPADSVADADFTMQGESRVMQDMIGALKHRLSSLCVLSKATLCKRPLLSLAKLITFTTLERLKHHSRRSLHVTQRLSYKISLRCTSCAAKPSPLKACCASVSRRSGGTMGVPAGALHSADHRRFHPRPVSHTHRSQRWSQCGTADTCYI